MHPKGEGSKEEEEEEEMVIPMCTILSIGGLGKR